MARKITRLTRRVVRMIEVEGVPLVIELTGKSINARIKHRRQIFTHSLGSLFQSAIRLAKSRKPEPLPQEDIDLRIPREA